MTTIDDDATLREDQFREVALAQRKPDGPAATGHCLACNALLPHGMRWCDASCREMYELDIEAMKRHRGRA